MARVFSYQYKVNRPTVGELCESPLHGANQWKTIHSHCDDWRAMESQPVMCDVVTDGQRRETIQVWLTGRLASQAMELHKASIHARQGNRNDTQWRVMPFESGTLTHSVTGTPLDEYLEAALNWPKREQARFDSGEYVPTPWHGQSWFDEPHARLKHFLHVSKQNPRRVTFTDGESNGIADRQASPMNVGRYFTRFARDYGLTAPRIAELALEYAMVHGSSDDFELRFAATPDEIVEAYTWGEENGCGQHSPTSCMSYSARHFGGQHPVQVYGAGDLQCAYLIDKRSNDEDEHRVTARAIVWPDKLRYSRIYGDETRLSDMLANLGYSESNNFDGARLLMIESTRAAGEYVMPYLDFYGQSCRIGTDANGDECFIVDRNGDVQCGSTNGRVYSMRCECSACGDMIDEDDSYSLDGDVMCLSCYEESTVSCDNCGHREHVDSDHLHTQHDDSQWCGGCEARYFICGHDGQTYRRTYADENLTHDNDDGFEIRIHRQYALLYFTCSESERVLRRADELAGYIGQGDSRPICRDVLDEMRANNDSELADFETVSERDERESRQLSFDLAAHRAANPETLAWTPDMPIPDMSPDYVRAMDGAERMAQDMSNDLEHESRVALLNSVAIYRARCRAYQEMMTRAQNTLAEYRARYGGATPPRVTVLPHNYELPHHETV